MPSRVPELAVNKGAQRIAAFAQNQRTADGDKRFHLLRAQASIHTCIAVAQHYKFVFTCIKTSRSFRAFVI